MRENEKSFILLDHPWIKVMTRDGVVETVSLKDAILNAHEYLGMAGELPTQDYALLRLLLAVLFAVFCRVDTDGNDSPLNRKNAIKRWKLLWSMGRFPQKPVEDYLEKWRNKFDLLHPLYPFYQVTEKRVLEYQEKGNSKKQENSHEKKKPVKGEKQRGQYTCAKLVGSVAQSGNKTRLFPNRLGEEVSSLDLAEATRWLIHLNAFDDTAAKTGTGVGWLGRLGIIFAEGSNLFETLMLNLTFRKDGTEEWDDCVPVWEVDEGEHIPENKNPAWTLTLQSRLVRLIVDNGRVVAYCVLGGDNSPKSNDFSEQMTIWGHKKTKTEEIYFPVPHEYSKQIWREFSTIADDGTKKHRPGVVSWIAALRSANNSPLDKNQVMRFHTLSVVYGDSNSSIANLFGDTLSFHTEMLTDMGAPLRRRVEDEIQLCDKIAQQVGTLASDLETAASGNGSSAYSQGMERYYSEIDKPFRDWLADLNPELGIVEDDFDRWRKTAVQTARRIGREMAAAEGDAAFVGRDVHKKKGNKEVTYHYSMPEAFNRFERELWKLGQ